MVPDHWIDFAMTSQGGTYEESEVDAVKCLYDVTIIFLCLIPYWIAHAQVHNIISCLRVGLSYIKSIHEIVLYLN